MQKNTFRSSTYLSNVYKKYVKLKKRLARSMQSGRFYQHAKRKQERLLARLERYYRRLTSSGFNLSKAVIIGAGVIASVPASAQTFTEVTTDASPFINLNIDSIEPFGILDVGFYSSPSFVDIDGDGDFDALIGDYYGNVNYFENVGSSTSPSFTLVSSENAFGLSSVIEDAAPAFIDIDGDNDFDAIIGEDDGNFYYFENVGSSTSPSFTLVSSENAFGFADVGTQANPTFADIDKDGDFDAFLGNEDGQLAYYENIGNSTNPVFSLVSSENPFGLSNQCCYLSPSFVDIDNDGDLDAFFGTDYSFDIFYYENISNNSSIPSFSLSTDTTPFGLRGSNTGTKSNIDFVDIDGDNDLDAFVGDYEGYTVFF